MIYPPAACQAFRCGAPDSRIPDQPDRSPLMATMNRTTRINFSRNRRQEMQELVEGAIRERVFPGMELLVARNEEVLLHEAWGHIEAGPDTAELQAGTLFDIASMTKPMTATCVMVLMEKGILSLEDKVWEFIPDFEHPDKTGITLIAPSTNPKPSRGITRYFDLRD